MKNLLLVGITFLAAQLSTAQTTIYSENFESGNSFTLNTTDLGAATTYNTWLMNNTYAGGSGTFVCLGFPFSFTVPSTPNQPAGITNSPQSNYMHIAAQAAVSSSISCASYIPSDGTCVSDESNFSRMTTPISTAGYSGVSLDFWWMCGGSPEAFGQVYYSLDGGITWVLKQSTLNNTLTWSQLALTDAAWDNQASLLFAFRFLNTTSSTAADPGFSVDQIVVQGTLPTNSITTSGGIINSEWCEGVEQIITVDFVAAGSYNAGNVYSVQISDALGSFAAPLGIGSLASSASGPLSINAVAPISLTVGSGYRVRVVASDPSTIGTDNGADLEVLSLPVVTLAAFNDVCEDVTPFALSGGSPAGGTYFGIGVTSGNFDPLGPGTFNLTYTYTDPNGCTSAVGAPITVNALPTVTLATFANICDNAGSLTLTGGLPSGGVYAGTGVTGGVFDPAAVGAGVYTIFYSYTDANNCQALASQTITVDGCSGLFELSELNATIFPNPASGSFSISGTVQFEEIQLVDLNGKRIKSYTPSEYYSLEEVPAGMYVVVLKNASGTYQAKLLVD